MASCWIEIDLGAIGRNYRAIQELVGAGVRIIAVVKANAYGHGAVEVARALSEAGAPMLAVTRIEEAIPIRAAGVLTPILLLAPAPPHEVEEIVPYRLTACISSYDDAERLSQAARKQGGVASVHLKIDTGMNRFGVAPGDAVEVARRVAALPNLELEAAFTHFAFAGGSAKDAPKVHQQFAQFMPLVRQISHAVAIAPTGFHCANSAATLLFPSMRLSCVRVGTILYGQMPSTLAAEAATQQRLRLENTFQAKTRVLAVRSVRAGQTVGYGGEWKAPRNARVAIIGIGFADGLSQEPQTRREAPLAAMKKSVRNFAKEAARGFGLIGEEASRTVTVRGQRASIVGRIAMQTTAIDVTDIEAVRPGDEVLVALRRTSAAAHLSRIYISGA
jgi:alanine racemase